jgi:hypothetical protein
MTEGFSGTGTYNLSGGTIDSYAETVGYAGTGTFNQSGGTHSISWTLYVGQNCCGNSPGQGTYNLTGGTLSTGIGAFSGFEAPHGTVVGDGEMGSFIVSDADAPSNHMVYGNLVVGGQVNGVGAYTITGTSAQTNVLFVPGGNGGNSSSSNGIANPNGALIVGEFGNGSFTQGLYGGSDSPTVYVAGDLVLGHQGTASGQ